MSITQSRRYSGQGLGDIARLGTQHIPQSRLGRQVHALVPSTKPLIDFGEREQGRSGGASAGLRKVVVPAPPVGDCGAGDAREPGDLSWGDQEFTIIGHAHNVHTPEAANKALACLRC
jgi:hypothetical protein